MRRYQEKATSNVEEFYWHGRLQRKCSRHKCREAAEYVAEIEVNNPRGVIERILAYFLCSKHARVFAKNHDLDFEKYKPTRKGLD